MKSKQGSLTLILTAVLLTFGATSAHADGETNWQKNHPRRAQVNGRLRNQDQRVENGVENGTLTKRQARRIASQDQAIRRSERRDAAANGGHITSAEQQRLNQRENNVSREINRDESQSQSK